MFKRVTNLIFLTWNSFIFWLKWISSTETYYPEIVTQILIFYHQKLQSIPKSKTESSNWLNCSCYNTNRQQAASLVFPSASAQQDTLTTSPWVCMTTFSASLTNVTVLLIQPHDHKHNATASLPLWSLKHNDLRALSRLVTSALTR